MTGRVSALIGAQAVVGVAATLATLAVADAPFEPASVAFVLFTLVLIGMDRLPPVYVELRRQASWVAPTDGAYVVGLVVLGPVGLVVAVALAELVTSSWAGRSPLKQIFNVVSITAGSAVGALAYAAIGGTEPFQVRTWVGAVLALAVITVWDTVVTAMVLSVTEGEPLGSTMRQMALAQAAALAVSLPFGLVALVLFGWAWPTLLLLVPIFAVLHVSTRTTLRQRAERQRIQMLARAAGRLVELLEAEDLVARIAGQARELVAGAAAVAVAFSEDGEPLARLVDDTGHHPVDEALLAAIRQIVGDGPATRQGNTSTTSLDRALWQALPPSSNILWVVHQRLTTSALVVAVFRDLLPDGGDAHRADVLATFVAHASTALTNVELHTDLRRSLEEEQALSRRKDEFVANVSHEFRTPLSSIAGAVETLKHRNDQLSPIDRDALFDVALSNSRRLRALIDDLLIVAEGDRLERRHGHEPVDIPALLEGIERQFRRWVDGTLHVGTELADRWVVTDGDKLRRVLVHLVDNARKYAPGTVVELAATQHPSELRFTVTDRGPGIAQEDRHRIFEPFVQLDGSSTRSRGGLGLGLHLCRELASTLGGSLAIDAAPGGGSRFTLTLPDPPSDPR